MLRAPGTCDGRECQNMFLYAQKPSPEMFFFFSEKVPIMLELCSISAYYASIILDAFMLQIWKTPPYYAKA